MKRYYQKMTRATTHYAVAVFNVWTGNANYGTLEFPTTMRANPTFSYSSLADFTAFHSGATYSITSFNGNSRTQSAELNFDSSAFGAGEASWLRFSSDAAYIAFDAEL